MKLKEVEIQRLNKFCKGLLKDDADKFDYRHHIDRTISVGENKVLLLEKINSTFPKDIHLTVDELKPKYDVLEKKENFEFNQKLKEYEVEAEKEFEKTLDKIEQDKTTNLIEEIYYIPKQFSKMVANKNARGFLLYGECGTGKSYSVIRAFGEVGKKFTLLQGHITNLELYQFLFLHKKENIILDDINILDNENNLNLLKACLSDNSRIVQYHTSSKRLTVPPKFLFEGTIILLLNNIPKKSESLEAVKSRMLTYELKVNYPTKIKIIYELAKQDYKNISKEKRIEIAKWIKKNTSPATENLNLRMLFTIYEMFRFDENNWKRLANKLIVNDEDLQLIVNGMGEKEWINKTGMSRRSYYNYKRLLSGKKFETYPSIKTKCCCASCGNKYQNIKMFKL